MRTRLCGGAVVLAACSHPRAPTIVEPRSPSCETISIDGHIPAPRPGCHTSRAFAHFAWEVFIALNWPAEADPRARGNPLEPDDPSQFGANDRPLAWQTWNAEWEMMPSDGSRPTPWDSYYVSAPPCRQISSGRGNFFVTPKNWPELYSQHGGLLLNIINMVRAGSRLPFQRTGPVIDGARQYVRYSSVFGREAYDCVRNGGKEEGSRCRKSKSSIVLPAATTKQRGAIAVKGAWRPWTSGVDEERFHHRDVLVVDYDDEGAPICRSQKMLLVGMHVVFKSSLIDPHGPKNWLWTTFEHASNTPDCAEFSFQRPEYGFSHEPEILPRRPHPPASKREPVMLCRVTPIPTQTQMVNRAYEKALEVGGHGPWSHYRLVGAQWQVGRSPMPTNGVANTILEAYAQDPKHSKHASCMTCHNDLAARGDYIWTIAEYFFDSAPESTRWDRIKSLSRPEAD